MIVNNIQRPLVYSEQHLKYVANVMAFPGPINNQVILTWDLPFYADQNNDILGVNVYRSFVSPFDGFEKINIAPITIREYNDNFSLTYVQEHPVSKTEITILGRQYLVLRASKSCYSNFILSEDTSYQIPVTDNRNLVTSHSNFFSTVYAEVLYKGNRIYVLYNTKDEFMIPLFDVYNSGMDHTAHVPGNISDYIIKYYTLNRDPRYYSLEDRIYYKVSPINSSGNEISSLDELSVAEYNITGEIDWVWKAAAIRNFWMIWFGGEDCLVYLRKWSGNRCPSCQVNPIQANFECTNCYGTGFEGGYVGPYEIKMLAISAVTKGREMTDHGNRITKDMSMALLPLPYLRTGDIVIRQNGERMILGPVENHTHRGVILQQEFSLSDTMSGIKLYLPDNRGPRIFNKVEDQPDQINIKGRTPSFEHITLGLSNA